MTTHDRFDQFATISAELHDATSKLDAVFRARGIANDATPVISSDDVEAIDAVNRVRAANVRLGEWLADEAASTD